MAKLKTYFLTGLIITGPVFLTVYLLIWLFNLLDGILGQFLRRFFVEVFGFYVPGTGFFVSLALIVLVGFIAKKLLGHRLAVSLERAFSGLPLIRNIYPAVKQIVLFVSQDKQFGFRKVVLVEYFRAGSWALGFLTNEQFESLNRATGKELVSVFVPTTPGPLTGNTVLFPKDEVLFPDISVNEALNIIISGGVFRGGELQKTIVPPVTP